MCGGNPIETRQLNRENARQTICRIIFVSYHDSICTQFKMNPVFINGFRAVNLHRKCHIIAIRITFIAGIGRPKHDTDNLAFDQGALIGLMTKIHRMITALFALNTHCTFFTGASEGIGASCRCNKDNILSAHLTNIHIRNIDRIFTDHHIIASIVCRKDHRAHCNQQKQT